MFDVLRFRNGVESLRAVRSAGYDDATYEGFSVRLPNPIGIAERNHVVHTTGARVHADLVVTRTPNRSRGASSLAVELAKQRIDAILDEGGLREFKGADLLAAHPQAVAIGLTAAKIQAMWNAQLERVVSAAAEKHAPRFREAAEALLRAEANAKSVSSAVAIPRTAEARMRANARALQLAAEKRALTPAERAEIMAYTGWGGLNRFFETRQGVYQLQPAYEAQYKIPGDVRPGAAAAGYEYFTPPELCETIARTIAPLLPAAENAVGKLVALEPSAGIGRFVEPFSEHDVQWTLVEQNRGQSRLLQSLYPRARVFGETNFETWCVENAQEARGNFNLIVANPPYGQFNGGATDRAFAGEKRAEAYFIRRCLKLLAREGVAVFVVPASIADADDYKSLRREMLEHWHVAAIARLPSSVFDVAIMVDVWICVGRGGAMPVDVTDQFILEGRYFEQHPEHVLGSLNSTGGRYGKGEVKRLDARNPYQMDKLLKLRPIASMVSYNTATAADGDVQVADVKSANRKRPKGVVPAQADTIDSGAAVVGKNVELGKSSALASTAEGARDRIVLTSDERHLARCCMLAEYVPRLRALALGNQAEYELGRSAHAEIAHSLNGLLEWAQKAPGAMESLRGLAGENVVGAKLFLSEVVAAGRLFDWPERTEGQLQDIAGAAKSRFAHGGTVEQIAQALGVEPFALVNELVAADWYLLPSLTADRVDYSTIDILPRNEFSSGDMSERYARAYRYAEFLTASAVLAEPAAEGLTGDARIGAEVVRQRSDGIVAAWGQFATTFAVEFKRTYDEACELAGYEDVETFIAHLEPASLYVAPGVAGAAVASVLETAGVTVSSTLAAEPVCLWRVGKRTAYTPNFVGYSRALAAGWYAEHVRGRDISPRADKIESPFLDADFLDAELLPGVFIFKGTINAAGSADVRDRMVALLNAPNIKELIGVAGQTLAVGESWVTGKVSQATVAERLFYGAALYLGNNRRRKVADESGGDGAAEAQRLELLSSVNAALEATPTMPEQARVWLRTKFIDLVSEAMQWERDVERVAMLKPDERDDALIRLREQAARIKSSVPKELTTALPIAADLSAFRSPEALVDALAKVDGIWLAVSPLGNGVIGWPATEHTGFVESSLHGFEYAAIRYAPEARERAAMEEALGNAMRAELVASERAQEILRHRLRLYAAPYVRRQAPTEMCQLLRWRGVEPGKAVDGVTLLPHQAMGAWQTFNDEGALMAFDVGVGKTYCGTATIVQHRQNAGVRAPVMVLPNPLTYKWCRDFARCAPDYAVTVLGDSFMLEQSKLTGQIEVASRRDTAEERARKVADFAAGLYDVLIMPRSGVSRMYPSLGTIAAFARRLREEELQVVVTSMTSAKGKKKADDKGKDKDEEKDDPKTWLVWTIAIHYLLGISVRERAQSLGKMVSEMAPLFDDNGRYLGFSDADQKRFDDAVAVQWAEHKSGAVPTTEPKEDDDAEDDSADFDADADDDGADTVPTGLPWDKQNVRHDQIRPDLVMVDEAQMFKNLWFPTRMASQQVKFLGSPQTSAQAVHLDAWLTRTREFHRVKVQLLSATPAKNSPIELYNMLGYISPLWLRERGINSVATFASRFLRVGTTLYVKASGDIESNASAVTAFSDIAALRAVLFRFATFLDSDTAALLLPPERRKIFAKPKPIAISTDIVLSPSERLEVDAMRAASDESSRASGRVNAEALVGAPFDYGEKDGSNVMLALSMLPRVGAQPQLSMVARPLYVGDLVYRPDTLSWHLVNKRIDFAVGAVSIDDLYATKRLKIPNPSQRRALIGKSMEIFEEFIADGGSFRDIKAADPEQADPFEYLSSWASFAGARGATLTVSCGWRFLPPRWWWDATTREEQLYMLRQIPRFQLRAWLSARKKAAAQESNKTFVWRGRIPDDVSVASGLFDLESYEITGTSAKDAYTPPQGGVAVVDALAPILVMVGAEKDAAAQARTMGSPVLFSTPSERPLLARTASQAKRPLETWVSKKSQSTARARFAERRKEQDENPNQRQESIETMLRRAAAMQFYPMLPEANKGIVNSAFMRKFDPRQGNENLWDVLKIAPSARIQALVKQVATYDKGKAQIIFCLEKDMQLAIYWALVKSGRPAARIGIMNADTAPTPAQKMAYANAFNGVENQPDTATLDIIIANSVAYEGIDLQVRTIAIHHFDLPWEPATLTQRNGRAWRQGNRNPSVDIVYYTAANSADGYRMQMLEGKGSWIGNIVKSEAFVLANPSADANQTREQQFMALCPDAEAAALVAARFRETEEREKAAARSNAAMRELGRTSRFIVQSRNAALRKLGREAVRALEVQVENGLIKLDADVAAGALLYPDAVKAMRAGTVVGVLAADGQGRSLPLVEGDVIRIEPPAGSKREGGLARVLRLVGDDAIVDAVIAEQFGKVRYLSPGRNNPFAMAQSDAPVDAWLKPARDLATELTRRVSAGMAVHLLFGNEAWQGVQLVSAGQLGAVGWPEFASAIARSLSLDFRAQQQTQGLMMAMKVALSPMPIDRLNVLIRKAQARDGEAQRELPALTQEEWATILRGQQSWWNEMRGQMWGTEGFVSLVMALRDNWKRAPVSRAATANNRIVPVIWRATNEFGLWWPAQYLDRSYSAGWWGYVQTGRHDVSLDKLAGTIHPFRPASEEEVLAGVTIVPPNIDGYGMLINATNVHGRFVEKLAQYYFGRTLNTYEQRHSTIGSLFRK